MQYVPFGPTGIKVSELCLGTMTFGNEADAPLSRRMMDRAFDAGVTFFDTADIYTHGTTEEIVGRWVTERREDIVLATKVHYPTGEGVNERGNSRLHILRGVEASLRRLRTDHLDVLYLHHWDDDTPLDESLAAMDTLVRDGKVVYCGVSNFSAWQTMAAIDTADASGFAPIVCAQPMYNLVKRIAETEILPMAEYAGLAVCPYSPVAAGLLTGKYNRGEQGRITNHPMYTARYRGESYLETAQRFPEYAPSRGLAAPALAIAWVAAHPAVTAPIVGARNLEQLDTALSSVEIKLSAEQRDAIAAFSPTPPRATDREDPKDLHIPKPGELANDPA